MIKEYQTDFLPAGKTSTKIFRFSFSSKGDLQ